MDDGERDAGRPARIFMSQSLAWLDGNGGLCSLLGLLVVQTPESLLYRTGDIYRGRCAASPIICQ